MNVSELLKSWVRHNQAFLADQKRKSKVYGHLNVSPGSLYTQVHQEYAPCFVLSTGRCGTQLLTEILERHHQLDAYHEPAPELVYHAKYAYENQHTWPEALAMAVDAARYELIRDSFLVGKTYAETNNRITFFAPQLATLYPKARFIHLVRKPESFVKSGLGRHWYLGTRVQDEGRLTPTHGTVPDWDGWNQTQKIAWLWNETNSFIEEFKQTQPAARCLTVLAEDLFKSPAETHRITDFLSVDQFPDKLVQSLIAEPVNKGKVNISLTEQQKTQVRELTPITSVYYPSKN